MATHDTPPPVDRTPPAGPDPGRFAEEEAGYHKGLKSRQIQMIAIGGAIGTGLFLGAGGRLNQAGPALVFIYALCGFFAFLVLRAMGELVLHRPSSGSFVSYAREFFGEKAAYTAGWMYWLNWAMTSIVDVTAVALYMKFFGQYSTFIDSVPQWVWALVALVIVLGLNLVSVKVFGEMEFWFALIKVVALVAFLLVGIYFVIFGTPVDGQQVGFSLITDNGGWLPNGLVPAIVIIQGVVFAYAAIELVGTTAGETENPEKVMPKAINTVIWRIAVFYVGSVLLLSLLLPYTAYRAGESPFVTFFSSIGVDSIGVIMNLVVLTAALSSLNAGLYSTGRILHSMAKAGSAPQFAARMNRAGVPYGGIALTAVVTLLGVGLNAIVPAEAFEIVLNVASLGILSSWATIVLCQLKLFSWSKQGRLERPSFRLFGSPYTGWLTLLFLGAVLVLIAFDYPIGTYTIASLVIIVPLLVFGWFRCRDRITAIAQERSGYTGAFPVVAARPLADEKGRTRKDRDRD
ncbi:amino acid permease [Nakamurella flavida]|uniref:Amino acid permease n=1 Tax=Nakamurella flavida TaxID=363630 RepID=A0A938YP40_9ACTN|nr:amino acid permease [Nakamurella flavida]MBM9476618.1 amino acid permease [Nakamurella flavida]MDP9778944.1 L-asparagine permease [Nakamurella flavida]